MTGFQVSPREECETRQRFQVLGESLRTKRSRAAAPSSRGGCDRVATMRFWLAISCFVVLLALSGCSANGVSGAPMAPPPTAVPPRAAPGRRRAAATGVCAGPGAPRLAGSAGRHVRDDPHPRRRVRARHREFNAMKVDRACRGLRRGPQFRERSGVSTPINAHVAYGNVNLLEGEPDAAPGTGVTIGVIDTGIDAGASRSSRGSTIYQEYPVRGR